MLDLLGIKVLLWITLSSLGETLQMSVFFCEGIGGLLGVAVGRMFYGLSMFHLEEGASKAALCYLISFLREKKWKLLDCQWMTPFLAQMGAVEIDREKFLDILNVQVKFRTPRGNWSQSLTWKNKDPFPKRSDHPVEWP